MRRIKALPIFVFLGAILMVCGNVRAETLTLSTYYPAPFGTYDTLRLFPRNAPACNAANEGRMYYDSGVDQIYYCDGTGYEELSGVWFLDNNNNRIYPFTQDAATTVGIGTTTPQLKLDINDGIIARGTFGGGMTLNDANIVPETQMIWYPRMAAFRAGEIDGTQWDPTNMGNYSVAFGQNSIASGANSFTAGLNSTASGLASIAMGSGAQATANFSVAIGNGPGATAAQATAFGSTTTASGTNSTAMGDRTIASEQNTFAVGNQTTASGPQSVAVGNSTTASGNDSFASGQGSQATANDSTAMGQATLASGLNSMAVNIQTTAAGNNSFAMNANTAADSLDSVAMGRWNVGGGSPTNWVAGDPLLEVGNGGGAGTRNNAFTVLKNANVGINTDAPTAKLTLFKDTNGFETMIHLIDDDPGLTDNMGIDATAQLTDGLRTLSRISFVHNGTGDTLANSRGAIHFQTWDGATFPDRVRIRQANTSFVTDVILEPTYGLQLQQGDILVSIGDVTADAYLYNSDESLKDNITPINNALAKVTALNGVEYDLKRDGRHSIGVTAQNVEQQFPEAVHTDEESGLKKVDYAVLIAPFIEAIKEQQNLIEDQQQEIQRLRNDIDELKMLSNSGGST